nr:DnaJ homolog subfamily C GRV2 isoform X1 [Tanacetum cinerariifolium]
MCIYAFSVSTMEPRNVKEVMTNVGCIDTMREELLQFKRLDVWKEPVPSSCTGQFYCEDKTAKNRATVLAGSVPLHWSVPLRDDGNTRALLKFEGNVLLYVRLSCLRVLHQLAASTTCAKVMAATSVGTTQVLVSGPL